MAIILAIETTTKNCSVSLFKDGNLVFIEEQVSDKYSHAEQLTLFIEKVIKMSNITLKQVNAIALSKGPGSYTGLRIGTSTAKGLCYSMEIPLISISTLKAMAFGVSKTHKSDFFCSMIDARRMEVFASIFDKDNNEVRAINADVVDKDTYAEFLNKRVLFFGDGAIKCKEVINHPNAIFIEDIFPTSQDLGTFAEEKYSLKDFEDVAYFEPYYLKDFVLGNKMV